jgi:hypothetical protein
MVGAAACWKRQQPIAALFGGRTKDYDCPWCRRSAIRASPLRPPFGVGQPMWPGDPGFSHAPRNLGRSHRRGSWWACTGDSSSSRSCACFPAMIDKTRMGVKWVVGGGCARDRPWEAGHPGREGIPALTSAICRGRSADPACGRELLCSPRPDSRTLDREERHLPEASNTATHADRAFRYPAIVDLCYSQVRAVSTAPVSEKGYRS